MSQLLSFTLVIICCFLEFRSFVSSYPCVAVDVCSQDVAIQSKSIYNRNTVNASAKELSLNITLNKVMNQNMTAKISNKTASKIVNDESLTFIDLYHTGDRDVTSWRFYREEYKKEIPPHRIKATYTGADIADLEELECQPKALLVDLLVLDFNSCTESEGKEKWTVITVKDVPIGFICRKVV